MRHVLVLIVLSATAHGQTPEQFKANATPLLESLGELGTNYLPAGLAQAPDLRTIQALRVEAAEAQVAALMARYEAGLDNINFLLQAQIELALARIDTTEDEGEQTHHVQSGLKSAIVTWQRIKELQEVGARGGDAAAEAQARQQVFRFYVWWHKRKAGVDVGHTLADRAKVKLDIEAKSEANLDAVRSPSVTTEYWIPQNEMPLTHSCFIPMVVPCERTSHCSYASQSCHE